MLREREEIIEYGAGVGRWDKQPKAHPFRRYIPSTEDNEHDELYVVAESSFAGYRTRGGGRAQGGGR